jgi:hypothetical protein
MRGTMTAMAACLWAMPGGLTGQQLKPETIRDFDCYVQAAEARMNARKAFLLADAEPTLNQQLVHGKLIQTRAPNGSNPHPIKGGQVYDWIGAVFIPGTTPERLIRMLQDYDHRDRYFGDVVSSSKLRCHTGADHFQFNMNLKEPAVIDTENDVVWERVDPQRWRCRSYSTRVQEIGKQHGYVLRLYSYWRFAGTENGVHVEGETIELSGQFGSVARAFGSLMGINPEKSLKRTLSSMRDSVLKPGLEFAVPAQGLPACGEPFRPAGCVPGP